MKLLSIIVPAYNVESYIAECIDSLIKNTAILEYLEIIVINDGSTDNTLKIIYSYINKYQQCLKIIDKENGGHGSGINKGVEIATGKYIKVLYSDDWFDTNSLSELLHIILSDNEMPDVIVNNYKQIWNDGRVIEHNYNNIKSHILVDLKEFTDMGYRWTIHSATFRTDILQNCVKTKIDENTSYDDVQYVLYPVPYIKSVMILDSYLYMYRMGNSGQSVSIQNMIKNKTKLKNIILNAHKYYIDNRENMSSVQKKYYEQDLAVSVGDYINIVLLDAYSTRAELIGFIEQLDIDVKQIPNKKLKLLLLTNYATFGIVKKLYIYKKRQIEKSI